MKKRNRQRQRKDEFVIEETDNYNCHFEGGTTERSNNNDNLITTTTTTTMTTTTTNLNQSLSPMTNDLMTNDFRNFKLETKNDLERKNRMCIARRNGCNSN